MGISWFLFSLHHLWTVSNKQFDYHFILVLNPNLRFFREGSCLPACDAYPDNLGDENYDITCDGIGTPSSSISTQAVVYDWRNPTPVLVGNKCTVTCRENRRVKFRDGLESFELTCQADGPNSNSWDLTTLPRCHNECGGPYKAWDEDVEATSLKWECTDDQFEGSRCKKTCPDGYKLKSANKHTVQCTLKGKYKRPGWKGAMSNCVPE